MKYIVWIKEKGQWVEQGDRPLTKKQATRIAREITQDCGVSTIIRPVGVQPPEIRRSFALSGFRP